MRRSTDSHSRDCEVDKGFRFDCSDDPNTNSVAVLIVHESLTVQYKKEIEEEQHVLSELRSDESSSSEEKREEIERHEVRSDERNER